MTLYSVNPNLKLPTVTTVRGDKEYRRNCKYISDKYYLMDRDCFCVDGRWSRFDGGNIVFDYENKVWLHKKNVEGLTKGIVDFKEDGTTIFGMFTPNPYNNVKVRLENGNLSLALDENILLKNGYIEDVSNGVWYSKITLGVNGIKRAKTIRNEKSFTDRGYNIEDNVKDFENKVRLYDAYSPVISKKNRIYSNYLTNITFGAEIEIIKGNLPENLQNRTGIVMCRDGSIDGGPELVTIPISGAKGVQTLDNISEYLKTRGLINIACSFHIHIGTIRKDKLFLVAFYQLCRKIQDELFTMFPYYKTDPKGVKRKNYNQKLESLNIHPLIKKDKESFEAYLVDSHAKIFDFLAEGKMTLDQFNKKTREHPRPRKWERNSRYYWSNLLNMFFGHRHTCEFRLHQATTNSHKMVNWLYICNAIVKYADKYATEIIMSKDSISLQEVFDIYKDMNPNDKNAAFLSDYIYAYYKDRRDDFQRDWAKGEKVSEWDMNKDKDYTFTYDGVTGLV